jgi:hypothetical protein
MGQAGKSKTNQGQADMSNVVRFPTGRYAPLAPTANTLAEELATLEVKLARARLAQIRSETRQANIYWSWFWFKRLACCALMLWLVSTCAKAGERKSFYGRNGSFDGSSLQRGNSATYYNGAGRFSGSSVRVGNQTLYYDHTGRYTGSIIDTSPRR